MKTLFRNLGIGLLYCFGAFVAVLFGTVAVLGIIALTTCTGFEAVWLFVASSAMAFMAGFVVFSMGAIHHLQGEQK